MSNYSDIIQGIKDVLTGASGISKANVHMGPPDAINDFPAVAIIPESFDMVQAFGGNSFEGDIRLRVWLKSGDDEEGWRQLWDYIDPTAASASLIRAIRADRGLNGKADGSEVMRIENIRRSEIGGGYLFQFDAILHVIKGVA